MSLKIKHNTAPSLKPCVMACDKPLSKHLDMYELSRIAFNKHATSMIIGRPGSGKSSFIQSIFCKKLLKGVYDKIFLFQPPTSRGSAVNDVFASLPPEQIYDELTLDNLEDCVDVMTVEPEHNYLIILDDMGSQLKNKSTLKLLKQLMMNKRHIHVSMMFLCQTYYSQNKEIRRLFDNYFVFKTTKNELANIADEVLEMNKDIIPSLAKLVYDKPYNYLYINVNSRRLFKNFDEIIVEEKT